MMSTTIPELNEIREAITAIDRRQVEMAERQTSGLEFHQRTHSELVRLAGTVAQIHTQTTLTNGRVNEHDKLLAALQTELAALQASERFRAGMIAFPLALMRILQLARQTRTLTAIIATAGTILAAYNILPAEVWAPIAEILKTLAITPPTP